MQFNEYSPIKTLALRHAREAFRSQEQADGEWEALRFHEKPSVEGAWAEYDVFKGLVTSEDTQLIELPAAANLTLDAIYVRDATIVSRNGLILCNMGRDSRNNEPAFNASLYENAGFKIAGKIEAPGSVEGGDFIWLDETTAAMGIGPRTNAEGLRQLHELIGKDVELHVVQLPDPSHPDDVFHLMSMISPLAEDLALIYRPLMPDSFIAWLEDKGVNFVEVPEEEFIPMGCNVLAVGPRDVVMLDRLPETRVRLEAAGCNVSTYTGDEISRKGEGGPTCLTRPLVRG